MICYFAYISTTDWCIVIPDEIQLHETTVAHETHTRIDCSRSVAPKDLFYRWAARPFVSQVDEHTIKFLMDVKGIKCQCMGKTNGS